MKNAGREACVHARQREQRFEILHFARAARCDDGQRHTLRQGFQHLQVKPPLHAVGIDAVQHDLPRAPGFAAHSPFQCVQTGILAPAFCEQVVFAVHAGHVHGEHHTLVAVFLRSRSDEGRVFDGPGIDAHLVRTRLEHPVEILQRIDCPAHGEGDEYLPRHVPQHVCEQTAPLHTGRDVVKYQLVGAGVVVAPRKRHGVLNVLHALEIHALYHAPVSDVQARDDTLCHHRTIPPPPRPAHPAGPARPYIRLSPQ